MTMRNVPLIVIALFGRVNIVDSEDIFAYRKFDLQGD